MNDKITILVCDKIMSGDFNTELSMPDYEPEVRRLLRVGVTLTPPAGFYDRSRAGMNGEIIYDVLYSGADGGLYSTRATEKYELAEAFKPSERWDDDLTLVCEAQPESIISRATGPRKLSLKCRVRGRARGFGEKEITERATYVEHPQSIVRLESEEGYTHVFPSFLGETNLSESFQLDGVEGTDVRIICCDASAIVEEIEPSRNCAVVKGVINLEMLAVAEDGESKPFKMCHKLNFAEAVDADGLTPECRCLARAVCTDVGLSLEDNMIFCEPTLIIQLDAEEDRAVSYTRDLFSTEVNSETVMKQYEMPASENCFSGNFTVSMHESAETLGIENDAELVDVNAVSVLKNIETDGEKWALVGETALNMLLKNGGEYSAKEIKQPFRYEIEGSRAKPIFTDCRVMASHPKAKLDGGRFSCECELHACGRMCSGAHITAVDEAVFGEPVEKDNAITVCFPSPTDTLWDVAKRYHVTTEAVISKNPDASGATPIII